jgi:hypothetical protein
VRRLRLDDADRARYGGPEWLDTDAAIVWLSAGLDHPALVAIEKQIRAEMGMVLLRFLAVEAFSGSLEAMRGRAWLALRHNGVEVELKDFVPEVLKMAWEPEGDGDADPPSHGAASSPSATPPSPKLTGSRTSRSSTSRSTRGSAGRTK